MNANFHSGSTMLNTRVALQKERHNHGAQPLSRKKVQIKISNIQSYLLICIAGGKVVPSKKAGENWWGYCGNCKGEVDKRCKATGHKVLRDPWRALKGCMNKAEQISLKFMISFCQ